MGGNRHNKHTDSPPKGQVRAAASERVPVNLAMVQIAPEHLVGGHVHVEGHGVLQRGDHLAVLALEQVDATDLVAVGEHQVGALSWRGQQREMFSSCCFVHLPVEVGRSAKKKPVLIAVMQWEDKLTTRHSLKTTA